MKGFSLLEIVVILIIISLLGSFAIPGYRDYMARARRIDGQTALLDLAVRMENYFSERHTYKTATIGSKQETDVLTTPLSSQGFYLLSILKNTEDSYVLKATAIGAQASTDTDCPSLTLSSHGRKDPTKPVPCW